MRIQCSCFDDSKRRRTGHRRRFFSWRRPHRQRKSRKMTTRMDDDDEDVYEDSNKRNIIIFYFTYANTRSLTHIHTKWFITFIIFIQIRNMIYYPYRNVSWNEENEQKNNVNDQRFRFGKRKNCDFAMEYNDCLKAKTIVKPFLILILCFSHLSVSVLFSYVENVRLNRISRRIRTHTEYIILC